MKLFKKSICLFACVLMLFGTFCVVFNTDFNAYAKTTAELRAEIDALNNKVDSVKKEQNALKSQINASKSTANTLSKEITNLTHEIDLIDEQIIIINSMLEQYNTLIAEQANEIAALESKIDKEQKMVDAMIRMSFEYGGTGSAVEFIFSAENFSDLVSRIDLFAYHLKYNTKVIENYSASLESLEKTKAEYEQSLLVMSQYKTEQEALQVELEAKQTEAEAKRAAALADASEHEKELKEKQAYIDALDKEIKDIAAMIAKESGSSQPYTGTFYFPLPRGVYRITSYYGYRKDPFTKKTAYHNGYDFACAKGTKIYAVEDGTVVIAKWNGGYGNCVTINHAGGLMSLYGHCSSLNVVAGQKVKRGDVIAFVGTTGRSTGNHLHFTLYKNGKLTDPAPYLGL